jgi:hypothetical protein
MAPIRLRARLLNTAGRGSMLKLLALRLGACQARCKRDGLPDANYRFLWIWSGDVRANLAILKMA